MVVQKGHKDLYWFEPPWSNTLYPVRAVHVICTSLYVVLVAEVYVRVCGSQVRLKVEEEQ
jgi:hypothetical protein